MIIKNPYNFIAKHYRLINILMLVPMIYLLLKFRDIAGFFSDFVKNGYKTFETNMADEYVTSLTFGATLFMLLYNGVMYFVFTTKKKNGLVYAIGAIYHIVLLVLALLFYNSMNSITRLDATFANFVRDMGKLSTIPMYPLILFTIAKALGFNIKTLQFDKNAELKVNEEDEEIEIRIGSEDNYAKKNLVHMLRELKYYVLENKFVFTILGGIAVVGALIGLYINVRITNRTYNFNQEVSTKTFEMALKESYITNVDYRGAVITPNKYYLVVKIALHNKSADTTIDRAVFRITFGGKTIMPVYDRSARFIDVGKPYEGQIIKYDSQDDYVFAYELTEKEIKSSYKLQILDSLKLKDNELLKTYKTFSVKPINIIKKKNLGEVKMGTEVKLKETTLGNSTMRIKDIDIVDSYKYSSKVCNRDGECEDTINTIVASPGKALMIIEDEIKLDEKSSYYKNSRKDFYGDFVTTKIKPKLSGAIEREDVVTLMRNVTPKALTDVKVYEVSVDALKSSRITMIVNIRNTQFTIKIR